MKLSIRKRLKPADGAFLYVASIADGDRAWVKIGISTELVGRMQSIQCGCPLPISGISYIEVADRRVAEWAEQAIHSELHEHRSAGEWFALRFDGALRRRIESACSRFIHAMEWMELEKSCLVRDRKSQVGRNAEKRAKFLADCIDLDRSRPRTCLKVSDVPLAESLSCYKS